MVKETPFPLCNMCVQLYWQDAVSREQRLLNKRRRHIWGWPKCIWVGMKNEENTWAPCLQPSTFPLLPCSPSWFPSHKGEKEAKMEEKSFKKLSGATAWQCFTDNQSALKDNSNLKEFISQTACAVKRTTCLIAVALAHHATWETHLHSIPFCSGRAAASVARTPRVTFCRWYQYVKWTGEGRNAGRKRGGRTFRALVDPVRVRMKGKEQGNEERRDSTSGKN